MTMSSSRRNKRIGDMMAGTFVLNERAGPQRCSSPATIRFPPRCSRGCPRSTCSRLDDRLALCVRQFACAPAT